MWDLFKLWFYNIIFIADGVDAKEAQDQDQDQDHEQVQVQDRTPKAENNNSFFLNGKTEKTNGLADISVNVSVINAANLSLERTAKIGELDDSDLKKTKVTFILINFLL